MDFVANILSGAGESKRPNESVEKFNRLCEEFLTKLLRFAKFEEKAKQKIEKLLDLVKSQSPIPFNIFKSGSNKENLKKMLEEENSDIFNTLAIVAKEDFDAMPAKTKKASWKYLKKLNKIAQNAEVAPIDLNSIGDAAAAAFQDLDLEQVGKAAYGLLSNVKSIFKRHKVEEKKFLDVTEDIVEAIPAVAGVQPKKYAGKARKLVKSVLFSDEWSPSPTKKIKK